MGDKHLEPVVTITSGTAEDNTIPPGTGEPPAQYGPLDRILGEMNAKMGTMADLIGKLCQSLDTVNARPLAVHAAHRATTAGKQKRVPHVGLKNRAKFPLVRNPTTKS